MPEIISPKNRIPEGSLILRCEVRGDKVYALLPEMTGSMDNEALATVLEMLNIQIGKLTELVMNERAKRDAAELPPDPLNSQNMTVWVPIQGNISTTL